MTDREAAAGLVAKLQARRERYSNHHGNYLMYSTFDAILDQEVAVALEAAEPRARLAALLRAVAAKRERSQ